MVRWLPADWGTVFLPSASIAELIVRATVIYLPLVVVFRALRRDLARARASDLLFLFFIATAVRQALTGRYYGIVDALITASVLLFWDLSLDYASYRWKFMHKILQPDPRLLIFRGRILFRNASRALLTREDIEQELRQHGVRSLSEVDKAFIEPDGKLSVLKRRQ